jgi:hypothetical protein
MLFKFNEFNDGIGKLAIRPGWQLDPGTRTPPGGRVRRPDYIIINGQCLRLNCTKVGMVLFNFRRPRFLNSRMARLIPLDKKDS